MARAALSHPVALRHRSGRMAKSQEPKKPTAKVIAVLKSTQAPITLQPGQDLVINSLDKEATDPDNAEAVEIEYTNGLGQKSTYRVIPNPVNPLKRLEIRGARIKGELKFSKWEPPIVDIGEMPPKE